ncbi:MAG TPA: sugar transferase [Holophagaceae bacterium]|nr:sugar transferase [Holophagaceae bacterium]
MASTRPIYRLFKRLMDFSCALLLGLILLPVLLVLWILIRIRMGSPVVFTQERAGRDAKPFTVFKFRSMIEAYDEKGDPLPDAERITLFGRFLRRSSLDELPQLWNVIRGDMSLVGPRPLFMEYVPHYSAEERRRLDVRPGVTGLAQINGRNTLGWEDRLRLDVEYVDRASIAFDLWILWRTLFKVLGSEGVPSTGLDPNKKFSDYRKDGQA